MSEPKFTPGPWKVEKVGVAIGPGPGRFIVCGVSPGAGDELLVTAQIESDGNEKADARLIAAAPRLYEELAKADTLLRRIEDFLLYDKRRPKRPEWFSDVQTTIAGTSAALEKAAAP